MAKPTFLEFPFEFAEVEGLGKLFYPLVQVEIDTVFGWKKFDFLVDTGADITTFSSAIVPFLGLDLSRLPKNSVTGVGGIKAIIRETQVSIRLGGSAFKIKASITQDSEEKGSIFLLGKKDIFEERFSLVLDSKRKVTVLKKN